LPLYFVIPKPVHQLVFQEPHPEDGWYSPKAGIYTSYSNNLESSNYLSFKLIEECVKLLPSLSNRPSQ